MELGRHDIQAFLRWWQAGLALLLPESWRHRLQRKQALLSITIIEDRIEADYTPADSDAVAESWQMITTDEIQVATTLRQINQSVVTGTRVSMVLPVDKVLKKSITLPAATRSDLKNILGFELDKHIPFKREQVYFSWNITRSDIRQDKIKLDLYVVLRENLDAAMQTLRELVVKPQVVTVPELSTEPAFNLLPEELQQRVALNYPAMVLPAVTVVLFLGMLYLPLLRHAAVLETLDTEVESLRSQAAEVQGLLDRRTNIVSRIEFLQKQRSQRMPVIDIAQELTSVLPDDTWINRLAINNNQIQFNGEAETASFILEKLENTDIFSKAQFRAPVVRNTGTNKDRFEIVADIQGHDPT